MRSGAQPPIGSTWQLGSVSEPRPPVGCSPRGRPFPPRPPPEVAFLCSVASSVLRPHPTSHPRTCSACGFCLPEPARKRPGTDETSQVPRKELPHVHKVSDCARFFAMQANTPWKMLPSLSQNKIGTSELDPFRSSILGPWSPLCTLHGCPREQKLVHHSGSG